MLIALSRLAQVWVIERAQAESSETYILAPMLPLTGFEDICALGGRH